MGLSKGVPDLLVFAPGVTTRRLAIEFKIGSNAMGAEQLEWFTRPASQMEVRALPPGRARLLANACLPL